MRTTIFSRKLDGEEGTNVRQPLYTFRKESFSMKKLTILVTALCLTALTACSTNQANSSQSAQPSQSAQTSQPA